MIYWKVTAFLKNSKYMGVGVFGSTSEKSGQIEVLNGVAVSC